MKRLFFLTLIASFTLFMSCGGGDDGLIFFSVEDDIELGKQVRDEIEADTSFVILSDVEYPEAYEFIRAMRDQILLSDEIEYDSLFDWEVYLVHDDEVLNAFATPGGYIYIYTGLIKFLDRSDDLAGVLGHEIAHSDRRHSIRQLQAQIGISTLLAVALGEDPGKLQEVVGAITGSLATLQFSRNNEAEADEYSVYYLSDTDYQCDGAKSFFEKLIEEDQTGSTPEFLSTHPDPAERVDDISTVAADIPSCTNKPEINQQTFLQLKRIYLPQ